MNNQQQITNYFQKIKEAHQVFVKVGNDKQGQILEAYQWIFDELTKLGVDEGFSIGLLIGGKDFLASFDKQTEKPMVATQQKLT